MPYTAEDPRHWSPDELRARIPGWGVDADPADRPSYPKQRFAPGETGAHWELPEQQPARTPRERSIEHARLTPVFGTAAPLHGLSGAVRRFAYARFSEGRAAHWLLLIVGDRIDVLESTVKSFVSGHPDELLSETGVLSEKRRHGIRSRIGHHRVDVRHQWIDPLLVVGPWLLAAWGAIAVSRKVSRTR
jgi:hypothetical protein